MDISLSYIVSAFFAVLFLSTGSHKLVNRIEFQGILQDYKLLPVTWVKAATVLLALCELTLGIAWVSGLVVQLAGLATTTFLLIYALAMAINLARGRTSISCGCSFGAGDALSWLHVFRNLLLIGMACIVFLPVEDRALVWVDVFSVSAALIVALVLYSTANVLIANAASASRLATWRVGSAPSEAVGESQ